MSFIFNEQTKLLAGAINTTATSCVTVGIATPLAGYIYNFGNIRVTLDAITVSIGSAGWLFAAIVLHSFARRTLRKLRP